MSNPEEESIVFVILLDEKIVGFQKKEEDAREAVKLEALRKQAELKGEWTDVSLKEEKNENSIAVLVQQLGRVYNSPPSLVHLVRFERVISLSSSSAEAQKRVDPDPRDLECESQSDSSDSEDEQSSSSSEEDSD